MRKGSLLILPFMAVAAATASVGPDRRADTPVAPTDDAVEQAAPSEVKGELVGVDVEARVLKVKVQAAADAATELTLPVESDAALTALGDLKAGDRVTVTCREGTSGDACVVTGVKKDEPEP